MESIGAPPCPVKSPTPWSVSEVLALTGRSNATRAEMAATLRGLALDPGDLAILLAKPVPVVLTVDEQLIAAELSASNPAGDEESDPNTWPAPDVDDEVWVPTDGRTRANESTYRDAPAATPLPEPAHVPTAEDWDELDRLNRENSIAALALDPGAYDDEPRDPGQTPFEVRLDRLPSPEPELTAAGRWA
jgi:hypothetical protein